MSMEMSMALGHAAGRQPRNELARSVDAEVGLIVFGFVVVVDGDGATVDGGTVDAGTA